MAARERIDALMANAAAGAACHAPFAAMYLTPRGDVQACCFNLTHTLGNVGEARLADIWWGDRADELRAAVGADDLSLGCQFCEWQVDEGAVPPSRDFDHLPGPGGERAGWPRRIELALSNRCNLACTMCNGELSSRIRRQREHLPPLPPVYDDRFFDDLEAFLPHLDELKLLGGEPTLSPDAGRVLDVLVRLGLRTPVHVTTNGMQLPAHLLSCMERLPMSFTVSLDAVTPDLLERVRVGADLDTVLGTIDRLHAHTEAAGTALTIACTLMQETWHELADLLLLAERRGIEVYVNRLAAPRVSSLYALEPDELDHVIAGLEARDAGLALERNADVWAGVLADLRAHRERLRRQQRGHATLHVRPSRRPAPGADAAVRSRADAAGLLGVPERDVEQLCCDAAEVVVDVSTPTFLGLDASWCLGRPFLHVVHAVEAARRGTASVLAEERLEGADRVRLRVEGAGEAVEVVLLTTDDGERSGGACWYAAPPVPVA